MLKKPILIAICGKSCTGKDSLAKWLYNDLWHNRSLGNGDYSVHLMVSDTTRPQRSNEISQVDYYFISEELFLEKINQKQYIEYSKFRNWYYGTSKSEICNNTINIGVFNLEGLEALISLRRQYNILPVLLNDKLSLRLKRSRDREGKWKIEFFRRAITDYKDFNKKRLKFLFKHFDIIVQLDNVDGVIRKTQTVKDALKNAFDLGKFK